MPRDIAIVIIVIAGIIAFISKNHVEDPTLYFFALVFLVLFFFFMTNSGDSLDDEGFKVDLNKKNKRKKKRRKRRKWKPLKNNSILKLS